MEPLGPRVGDPWSFVDDLADRLRVFRRWGEGEGYQVEEGLGGRRWHIGEGTYLEMEGREGDHVVVRRRFRQERVDGLEVGRTRGGFYLAKTGGLLCHSGPTNWSVLTTQRTTACHTGSSCTRGRQNPLISQPEWKGTAIVT